MKKIFLCSGQGSFVPGVGKYEYDQITTFRDAVDRISAICELDIPYFCWGAGRIKVKNDPYLSHVVLWALSYAVTKVLWEREIKPDLIMGHSLGEIIAICLSGCIPLEDACALISYRGKLFKQNQEKNDSDMVAVIGDNDKIAWLLQETSVMAGVYIANYNTPSQVVFSMKNDLVEDFYHQISKKGLRTVKLNVGNGCHSPYVLEIQKNMEVFADSLFIEHPKTPVFSCITLDIVDTAEKVKDVLKKHVISSVRWWEGVNKVYERYDGNIKFVDLSYSNVLKGLVLNCGKDLMLLRAEGLLKEINCAI
ncbi:MAG: ACP S-malonyltransferase [Treponemataceae bacterium]|nr:ACP S-malonyltransferase [Treponemataceae bacterium]